MADISNITVSAEGVDTVCKIKDKVARNDIAINRTTLGVQCKNLLKNNAVTQTVSGITFTVNDDYSITLNGTATAIIWLQVGYTKGEHFRKEKLIFTGNPSGTGSGNGLEAWYLNSTTGNKYVSIANGNILTESEYDSSGVIVYEFHIAQGRTYNNVTYYPMLRYADITDDTYEPYKESVDERLIQNKSDIAVNKTTLGTQCKNLFDWKNATYSTSLRLTQTKTESNISVTSTGSWAVTAYKLPTLEVGTAYIFSTTISDLSVAGGKAYVVISTSTSSSNIVKAAEITNNGTATIKFEATSNTMYVLFYPNYSDTVYTNSFTASNIMLRYADITDATYETYKKTVDERLIQNKSDIAVNKTTLGTQCKNLLKNNAVTQTVSGVTFTINDDKSITVNGTATAQISFIINNKVGLGIGNYILTGCPSGGSWNTFYLTAYASSAWLSAPDFGSGCKIENKTVTQVVISIASGYTANNLKFYPMLRDAEIMDDTYEEYIEDINTRLNNLLARIEILEGSSS